MGDDCEKFGAWPKTYKHVYEDRWLARFFEELEKNRDWIELVRLSDYLAAFPPLRKVYIPDASYPEMMEWALPVQSREAQHRCLEKLKFEPDADQLLSFVRGGYWRNFLTKYPEADFLHKKMLAVSRRVETLQGDSSLGSERQKQLQLANLSLLQSQCNDAYWHGVFGGIYAPHLRTELLASLIEASHRLDLVEVHPGPEAEYETEFQDFDGDGKEEMLVRSPQLDLYIQLADGATLREIDFKPSAVPLINSLKRQPEFYHRYLSGDARGSGNSEIRRGYENLTPAERELDRFLRYDRYARHCFRLYLFPEGKGLEDYDRQNLEENQALAAGPYQNRWGGQEEQTLWPFAQTVKSSLDGACCSAELVKSYHWATNPDLTAVVGCHFSWEGDAALFGRQRVGIENVINFLAPTSWDRAIFSREEEGSPGNFEERLSWRGVLAKRRRLGFVDGWRGVEVQLCFDWPVDWWIVPLYTVSRSEEGLEKIYQGTQAMAVLNAQEVFSGQGTLHHWLEIRKI
jgi:alpha-amylase